MLLYFVWIVPLVVLQSPEQLDEEKKFEFEVKYFNMSEGFASSIANPAAQRFIEIVEQQKKQIAGILSAAKKESKKIKRDSKQNARDKYDSLLKVRNQQDNDLRQVLLKEQLEQIKLFPFYEGICRQGFAASLINGPLAQHLDLSNAERIKAREAAHEAIERYRQSVSKAQVKAIAKLQQSLPEAKQKKLNALLKPLFRGNGAFWDVDVSNLDPMKPNFSGFIQFTMPPIEEPDK